MTELILRIGLIILIVIQVILLIQLIVMNFISYKRDKAFWKKQDEISNKLLEDLKRQHAVFLEEGQNNEDKE